MSGKQSNSNSSKKSNISEDKARTKVKKEDFKPLKLPKISRPGKLGVTQEKLNNHVR